MLAFALLLALAVQGIRSCGVKPASTRIINGVESDAHEWPWQASLRSRGWLGTSHICGATIINQNYLVTASHCVDGSSARSLTIVVGDHDKSLGSPNEASHSIERIIMHEEYDGNSLATDGLPHDIALLKLATPLEFNERVSAACLPPKNANFVNNRDCWITGWGVTHSGGNENVLNELNIDVRTNEECSEVWGTEYIKPIHICLGHGQSGACNGDSGGPLVCKMNGKWVLAGATSWGASGCEKEGYPSVYTRISEYIEWIEANMR